MLKHLPNLITLLNLLAGSTAIVALLQADYLLAFWLLFVAVFADFFDGLAARLLRVHSALGEQLDSLADMVSFGLAPGIIVYSLIDQSVATPDSGLNFLALPAFLLTLFSALRLGLFNLDTEQQKDFRGLPTPAGTTYFAGLMLICHFDSFGLKEAVGSLPFLYLNILLFSFLLISPLPMFSLKTKHFRWAGNELRYTFILLVILLILFLQEAAFSVIILLYVLISFIRHLSRSPGLKATNRSDI